MYRCILMHIIFSINFWGESDEPQGTFQMALDRNNKGSRPANSASLLGGNMLGKVCAEFITTRQRVSRPHLWGRYAKLQRG